MSNSNEKFCLRKARYAVNYLITRQLKSKSEYFYQDRGLQGFQGIPGNFGFYSKNSKNLDNQSIT